MSDMRGEGEGGVKKGAGLATGGCQGALGT